MFSADTLKLMLRFGNLSVIGRVSTTNSSPEDLNAAMKGLNEALEDPLVMLHDFSDT